MPPEGVSVEKSTLSRAFFMSMVYEKDAFGSFAYEFELS